jgi:hypothetical protein
MQKGMKTLVFCVMPKKTNMDTARNTYVASSSVDNCGNFATRDMKSSMEQLLMRSRRF